MTKVCNNCILDDKALDRSKSVCELVKVTSWFLIKPKEVTAIVYRYIQEGMYSTAICGSIVDIRCIFEAYRILKAIFVTKIIFTRQKNRDCRKKYLLFFIISFPTFLCRLFESIFKMR